LPTPPSGIDLKGIGITNQRETVVAWNPSSGEPVHRALVWQDRRTAARCDELREAGHEALVRERTGLVIDPYFSGTKIEWLIQNADLPEGTVFGTIDSWLVFKLTGRHLIDYSNASRTMLFDIRKLAWDEELCGLLGVDQRSLPEPVPSSQLYGTTSVFGGDVPVAGIAGDQQAALFGQACQQPGETKNTYGTGSFVLLNTGTDAPEPGQGLLTTVAWGLGDRVDYALEAAVFVTGAAVQWLRDGLGIISGRGEASAGGVGARTTTSTSCRPSPGSARRIGTRTRAERSSGSPGGREGRNWHGPPSRRSPTRRSTRCVRRRPHRARACRR
jgi:glycerol kinase